VIARENVVPIISVGAAFRYDTARIDAQIADLAASGPIRANVYNLAKSSDGTYYWNIINNGRGPVRPVHAKVLHWIDPKTGKDVFSMYSGPVAPRHMRENSMAAIRNAIIPGSFRVFDRITIERFVSAIAELAVQEMKSRTPVVTGLLRNSYFIQLEVAD
jgi:hypothetical protein